jgi:hypothetical protein
MDLLSLDSAASNLHHYILVGMVNKISNLHHYILVGMVNTAVVSDKLVNNKVILVPQSALLRCCSESLGLSFHCIIKICLRRCCFIREISEGSVRPILARACLPCIRKSICSDALCIECARLHSVGCVRHRLLNTLMDLCVVIK